MNEKASRYPDTPENPVHLFTVFLHSSSSFLFLSLQVLTPHLEPRQGFLSGVAFSSLTRGTGRHFLSDGLSVLLFPVLM